MIILWRSMSSSIRFTKWTLRVVNDWGIHLKNCNNGSFNSFMTWAYFHLSLNIWSLDRNYCIRSNIPRKAPNPAVSISIFLGNICFAAGLSLIFFGRRFISELIVFQNSFSQSRNCSIGIQEDGSVTSYEISSWLRLSLWIEWEASLTW